MRINSIGVTPQVDSRNKQSNKNVAFGKYSYVGEMVSSSEVVRALDLIKSLTEKSRTIFANICANDEGVIGYIGISNKLAEDLGIQGSEATRFDLTEGALKEGGLKMVVAYIMDIKTKLVNEVSK